MTFLDLKFDVLLLASLSLLNVYVQCMHHGDCIIYIWKLEL